jgi:hypothetical protein
MQRRLSTKGNIADYKQCDRELPICSQCSTNNLTCQYPTINKRGIPSGYISLLEQRLLETELVLFELLSTLYNSSTPIEPYRSTAFQREAIAAFMMKQSKNEKIEEWRGKGLATDEQRYGWWRGRCGIAGGEQREESRSASASASASGSGSGSGNGGGNVNGFENVNGVEGGMRNDGPQLQELAQDIAQIESPRTDGQFSVEAGWQPVGVGFSVPPPLASGEEVMAAPLRTEGQWRKYF